MNSSSLFQLPFRAFHHVSYLLAQTAFLALWVAYIARSIVQIVNTISQVVPRNRAPVAVTPLDKHYIPELVYRLR